MKRIRGCLRKKWLLGAVAAFCTTFIAISAVKNQLRYDSVVYSYVSKYQKDITRPYYDFITKSRTAHNYAVLVFNRICRNVDGYGEYDLHSLSFDEANSVWQALFIDTAELQGGEPVIMEFRSNGECLELTPFFERGEYCLLFDVHQDVNAADYAEMLHHHIFMEELPNAGSVLLGVRYRLDDGVWHAGFGTRGYPYLGGGYDFEFTRNGRIVLYAGNY